MTKALYLHGFASSPASRKAQLFRAHFAEAGYELLVPDLVRGDFRNLTLSSQLKVIAEVCDGAPAALIGSSMGGYLAALHAARHPETKALVLMAPAFGFAPRWAAQMGAAKVEEWRTQGTIDVFHYAVQREEAIGYTLLEDSLRYEETPVVAQPTLIWHGLRDDVVPVGASRAFVGANPGAELVEVDDGHELSASAEAICDAALAFLQPYLTGG